jgi:lipoprotein signal peptidase
VSADDAGVSSSTVEPAADQHAVPTPPPANWLRKPWVAGLALLVVYVAMSVAMDPNGFLGTDTGGKVATVKVMSERGDFDPDVGYWAAPWDPDARVHGLYYTSVVGDRYINVTTLPMVLAARPLYDVGGYRATLLLPMAGAIAAAFAARALSTRLRPDRCDEGWATFWLIGLASPVVIYALDLWEHAIGVGLMAWGTVALFDAVFDRPSWWRGLVAGVAFGAAASMRTESFVYVVTSTAIACATLVFAAQPGRRARDIAGAMVIGATAVAGFVLAFGAGLLVEVAVLGGQLRGARTSGAASAGLTGFDVRAEEGLVTLLSPFPTMDPRGYLAGACLLLALVYVARASNRKGGEQLAVVAAAVAGLVLLWRFSDGLGFVPGLVAATPFAAAGLAWGFVDARNRFVALLALVPIPLVVAFQFVGGAAPQWAGRYLLVSGFLLAVIGISQRDRMANWAGTAFVVASIAVTAFGVAWMVQRTHEIADAAERLQARTEAVLISPNGFVPREFGATYGDKDWLASGSPEDLAFAVEVAGESGAPDFALVDLDTAGDPPTFAGWDQTGSELVPFLGGVDLRVTTYERA